MKRYIWNLLILLDCAVDSVFFFSSPFETISSRVWRHRDNAVAYLAMQVIDWVALHIFSQADHCRKSEQNRLFYENFEVLG